MMMMRLWNNLIACWEVASAWLLTLSCPTPQWIQASLPVNARGLRIRRVLSLALSAFQASAASTHSLQSLMLFNCHCRLTRDNHRERLMRTWTTVYNTNTLGSPGDAKPSVWNVPGVMADQAVVMSAFTDNVNSARLLAASAPHIYDWLHALPLTTCGLRLDKEKVRVAVGLRLGTKLCEPHQCSCDRQVDASDTHGLSRNPALADPYDITNSTTWYTERWPEQARYQFWNRQDCRVPIENDRIWLTLIPWQRGTSNTWNVTVIDTIADSYLHLTSAKAGGAAENAAVKKEHFLCKREQK